MSLSVRLNLNLCSRIERSNLGFHRLTLFFEFPIGIGINRELLIFIPRYFSVTPSVDVSIKASDLFANRIFIMLLILNLYGKRKLFRTSLPNHTFPCMNCLSPGIVGTRLNGWHVQKNRLCESFNCSAGNIDQGVID